jgi:hypothetical protein
MGANPLIAQFVKAVGELKNSIYPTLRLVIEY